MDQGLHQPDELDGYLGFLMHKRRAESSSTLLQHFGFKEDPFRISPDPRYMFPSQTHIQALESLENGFYNDRGFIAMIAPPGMGKTTLLYKFLEDTQATARSVFLFDIDPDCEPRDFVAYILREFGINPASTSSEMHNQLGEVLVRETDAGRKCVIVIDEAQNLSDAVLERVRLLTNFETSQGKLLQIILSGQQQLTDKLLHASLVQLRQRVSTVCRLELLSHEETVNYIDYRLMQAGYDGDPLFSEEALNLIAENGKGVPRTINNLCYNSLALCSAIKSKQVDAAMVAKIVANLQLLPQWSESAAATDIGGEQSNETGSFYPDEQPETFRERFVNSKPALWIPSTVVVIILCVLGAFRLGGVGSTQPRDAGDNRILNPQLGEASVPAPVAPKNKKVTTTKPASDAKSSAPGSADTSHDSPASQPGGAELSRSDVEAANPPAPQQSSNEAQAPASQGGSPASGAAPALTALSIDSSPQGAEIEIDGAFVGNTPSTISVAPGSHRVSVNKKGFSDWGRNLYVSSGTVHLDAVLDQGPPKE